MIAPLRRRHRTWITALLLAVPALAFLALVKRPDVEIADDLPAVLLNRPLAEIAASVDRGDLFPDRRIQVRQWRSGVLAIIEIEPLEELGKPDVLAYWSLEEPSPEESLPGSAFLLGPVATGGSRAFPLPRAALRAPGHLVLYSLGHGDIVALAKLPPSEVQLPPTPPSTTGEGGA